MAFGLWRDGSFLRQGQYTPWRMKDLGSLSADGYSIASGVCSLHFVPFDCPSWSTDYESEKKASGCSIMGTSKRAIGHGTCRYETWRQDHQCTFWKSKKWAVLGLLERRCLSFRFS